MFEAHFMDGDTDVQVKVATRDKESLRDNLNRIREIDDVFNTHNRLLLESNQEVKPRRGGVRHLRVGFACYS